MSEFNYEDIECLPNYEDAFIAKINANLECTRDLLASIAKSLSFPDYFGENWNALSDCLRDFIWIEQKNIVLIHENLPKVPKQDLSTYLKILKEAVDDWQEDEAHKLIVVFDKKNRDFVNELIA